MLNGAKQQKVIGVYNEHALRINLFDAMDLDSNHFDSNEFDRFLFKFNRLKKQVFHSIFRNISECSNALN